MTRMVAPVCRTGRYCHCRVRPFLLLGTRACSRLTIPPDGISVPHVPCRLARVGLGSLGVVTQVGLALGMGGCKCCIWVSGCGCARAGAWAGIHGGTPGQVDVSWPFPVPLGWAVGVAVAVVLGG